MKQGEIWQINLDPTVGAEIRKTRPAVIVNDNALGKLPLKIVVPITDWKERYEVAPWMVNLSPDEDNNLIKESAADCFQIRSLSVNRFSKKIGVIGQKKLEDIKEALIKVLSIRD
ncbi:MAG TPA: type II toxin-antitoxin system PemK/MazF family toxin [Candidatus Rifleibacterium sp.]|nr:type II toxin-antitoxin system PemK/MazF family toxin [Candidatus Rifleibacterium sp.]HPT47221.1 type II toxin-antitoxin system PemK/MazF family toxin [Candidatus Rifleibacterium sp.]